MKSPPNLETQLHLVQIPALQNHDVIKWLPVDGMQKGLHYFGIVLLVLTPNVSKDTTLMENLSQHYSGIHISQFLSLSFDTMSNFSKNKFSLSLYSQTLNTSSSQLILFPFCLVISFLLTSLLIAKIHLL